MASVFDDRAISYALEKIGDFIRNSGSGAIPEWSDAASKVIVGSASLRHLGTSNVVSCALAAECALAPRFGFALVPPSVE
jgi:hypothetical protein